MDHLADAIISDPISEVLPLLCEGPSRERACKGVRGTKSPDEEDATGVSP
jgi:hypothetical protein